MPGYEMYIPDWMDSEEKPEVKTGVMTEEELNEIPF